MRVVVLGAGIIGISSAISIQAAYPSLKVTIIADKLSPNVTSDVAAGFWCPHLVNSSDPKLIERISEDTFKYISSLLGENCGALWQSGNVVSKEVQEIPYWRNIVRGFRVLNDKELKEFGSEYKSGQFFTTLTLEPTAYIAYATKKFISRGGNIIQKKIEKISDIAEDYDIIINCTGLGSRQLLSDNKVSPIRGQVIRVRAPSVKHFFIGDEFYCLLNRDVVILGGTHDEGEWDTTPSMETAQHILDGNIKNIPELKSAEIISHHVGLRPFRDYLRLDKEIIRNNGKETILIHNYGHGGSGITLFWGSALHVIHLLSSHINISHI